MQSKQFGFAVLFSVFSLLVQAQNTLLPLRETSTGNHEHTSRDELIQMAKDSVGNLLLLGFVEGDSIFADVSLQKISPEGSLLWDYRFDSPTKDNYDRPVKMIVDEFGNALVLAVSTGQHDFFSAQPSIGHLLKISADGQLRWQVDFDTLLAPHQSNLFFDAFLDGNGNYMVTYSTYIDFGERPTYFMKFSPEGHLIQSFKRFNIAQSDTGGPSAYSEAVDYGRNFMFVQGTNYVPLIFSSRKINPETQVEKVKTFNLANLTSQDSLNFGYLTWERIFVDENDEIYSFNNNDFIGGGTFFLTKIDTSGQVNFILRPDSIRMSMSAITFRQGFIYITGSYTPNGGNRYVAFLWKLNRQGQLLNERIEEASQDCLPRSLAIIQEKLYWATEDLSTGAITLKEFNKDNLAVNWVYHLNHDQNYHFNAANMVKLQNGLLAIGGTLRKEKYPASNYFSEEDFYVELLSPTQQELYAQYRMTERGTTNTEGIAFSVDPFGNKYVKTIEKYGAGPNAPGKNYYHKFSTDLTLQWQIDCKRGIYSNWGIEAFYFDHTGNLITFEQNNLGNLVLQKISPAGIYLDSFSLVGYHPLQIFIDRQDRVHLALAQDDGTRNSLILNNLLQPTQPVSTGFIQIKKFQLPADPAVYAYVEKLDDGNPGDISVSLLKDEQLLWKRNFSPNTPNEAFNDFDLDPNTGDLLASTYWYDANGFYEPRLHRFTMSGSYSNAPMLNAVPGFVFDIALMPNGNMYVVHEGRLDLYNSDYQVIKSIPISDAPSGGNYFKRDTVFYRAHNGILGAYSEHGLTLFNLVEESCSWGFSQIHIDPNRYLSTASTFGELIGANYAFGWRWSRGRLRVFDLQPLMSTPTNEPVAQNVQTIICRPIPASNGLQIDAKNFLGKDINLRLSNILGTIMTEKTYKSLGQSNISLDLSAVADGSYILSILSEGKVLARPIVVIK